MGVHQLDLTHWFNRVKAAKIIKQTGKVTRVIGLTIEVRGIAASIGEICNIIVGAEGSVRAEVVGFRERDTLLMPLGELHGIHPGCPVVPSGSRFSVQAGKQLLGRILDGLGRPIDGKGPIPRNGASYPVDNPPPNPLKRQRITEVLTTGIRAVDALLTCGRGQRIGIFSGSGVGKSTLMGMIARYSDADVNVIALIGERGREVRDFIEEDLGPEGLKKSVVVSATSDQPALVRLKGAFVATAIAEYFRDQGKSVLLMMDSITRFAMAQREVGLAIGEPPATKGYTPSVFALLPKLLERSGMSDAGSITAFYSVLVDGDDMNEPIADAVRGILDGHIVLSRKLAGKNLYPSIDILNSISRIMPEIVSRDHLQRASLVKDLMATYQQSEDLINIGAYVSGTNKSIDKAIAAHDHITDFIRQDMFDKGEFDASIEALGNLVS